MKSRKLSNLISQFCNTKFRRLYLNSKNIVLVAAEEKWKDDSCFAFCKAAASVASNLLQFKEPAVSAHLHLFTFKCKISQRCQMPGYQHKNSTPYHYFFIIHFMKFFFLFLLRLQPFHKMTSEPAKNEKAFHTLSNYSLTIIFWLIWIQSHEFISFLSLLSYISVQILWKKIQGHDIWHCFQKIYY